MLLPEMTGIDQCPEIILSDGDIRDLMAEHPSLKALTVHGKKVAILREASENAQPKGEVTVQESPFTISPPSPSRSPF